LVADRLGFTAEFDPIAGHGKARHYRRLKEEVAMKRYMIIVALMPLALAAGSAQARNYDCSKPGNANKAACKGKTSTAAPVKSVPAAAKPMPAKTVAATPAKTVRNYDCSKPGNANKAVCKGTATATAPAPKPAIAPAAKPVPAPKPAVVGAPVSRPAAATGTATGKCKDGTETHATSHRGACSHHSGVAAWY
jgi:cytoskeletal protein RodZ